MKKLALQYFVNYPQIDIFYFTSDNLVFFEYDNAKLHAHYLEDKKIVRFTREECLAEAEEDQTLYDTKKEEYFKKLSEMLVTNTPKTRLLVAEMILQEIANEVGWAFVSGVDYGLNSNKPYDNEEFKKYIINHGFKPKN